MQQMAAAGIYIDTVESSLLGSNRRAGELVYYLFDLGDR